MFFNRTGTINEYGYAQIILLSLTIRTQNLNDDIPPFIIVHCDLNDTTVPHASCYFMLQTEVDGMQETGSAHFTCVGREKLQVPKKCKLRVLFVLVCPL